MGLKGPTDGFRRLAEIDTADARWQAIAVADSESGQWRRKTIEDHHREIDQLALPDSVPESVRIQFDNARNLLLYSWLVFRFDMSAQLQAYTAVELALRQRIPQRETGRRQSLRRMLHNAVESGWLSEERFRHFLRIRSWRPELLEKMRGHEGANVSKEEYAQMNTYVRSLQKSMPPLRNILAHGSETLYSGPTP